MGMIFWCKVECAGPLEKELSSHCYFGWMGGLLIFFLKLFSEPFLFVSSDCRQDICVEERVDLISLLSATPQSMLGVKGLFCFGQKILSKWFQTLTTSFFHRKKRWFKTIRRGFLSFFFKKKGEAKMVKHKCHQCLKKNPCFFCTRPDSYLAVHYPNPDRWMCRWGSDFDRGWHREWNHGIEKKGSIGWHL